MKENFKIFALLAIIGSDERTISKQQQTSSNEYRNAINLLDNALQATDSILVSTPSISIQSSESNSICLNQSDLSTSNTNDNSLVSSKSKGILTFLIQKNANAKNLNYI